MNIRFRTPLLRRLYEEPEFTGSFSRDIVIAYRKRIGYIIAATDTRDFYAMKSLHFERLKGNRKNDYSIRLNDQWWLILQFEKQQNGKTAIIISIEDYH